MRWLSVTQHQLRVAARRSGTYWRRFLAGLVGVLLAALALALFAGASGPGRPAGFFGGVLVGPSIPIAFLLYAWARRTSDALSRERRDGTLPLLMLTGLGGRGVVLTKLSEAVVFVSGSLLALVPGLSVFALAEFIELGLAVRLALALVALLLVGAALGLAISAFCRERKTSESLVVLAVVVCWAWATPAADFAAVNYLPGWPADWKLSAASPMALPGLAYQVATGPWSTAFTMGLGWAFVETVLLLGIASWRVECAWGEGHRPAGGWRGIGAGLRRSTTRSGLRWRPVDRNPFYWLAVREDTGGWVVWSVLAFGVGMGAGAGWLTQGMEVSLSLSLALFCTLLPWYLLLKFLVADASSRVLFAQRDSGALEFLLATPLAVQDILRGQCQALWRRFALPAGLFLALSIVAMGVFAAYPPFVLNGLSMSNRVMLVSASMVLLVADMVTLAWVGMWVAMSAKRREEVAATTFGWVLVLPGLLAFAAVVSLGSWDVSTDPGVVFLVQLGFWVGIGLLADVLLLGWVRWRLPRKFREWASPAEYEGRWWRALGRRLGRWYGRLRGF